MSCEPCCLCGDSLASFSPQVLSFKSASPQVCLVVVIEKRGDEAECVSEDGHLEPVREGTLSEEIVRGVGSNGHKLTLGERKRKRTEMGEK